MALDLNNWIKDRTCKSKTVKINEACLHVFSEFNNPVHLLQRSVECFKCNFTDKGVIQSNETLSLIVDTNYATETYLSIDGEISHHCQKTYYFEDFGHYAWNVSNISCNDITVIKQPESFWFNLGTVVSVYIVLVLAYLSYKCVRGSSWFRSCSGNVPFQELEADLGNPENREQNKTIAQARTKRLSRMGSVDVFRGIAITIMIFVNYGGGGYSVFKHAPWNGLTIADVVFPMFIWIMGVSIALSLRSQLRTCPSKKKILYRIVKRTVILIALGIMLNSGKADLRSLRIPGVLQRIGLTYFIVASVEVVFTKPQRNERFGPWYICPDILDSWMQWIFMLTLTTAHVLLTFLLRVPGCPSGYLGPGGLEQYGEYENCTGGSAGYIDRLLLTSEHIYRRPTCYKIYENSFPYDPEGLLGALNSVLCAFLGVHAGRVVLCYENTCARIKRWLLWALITGITAGLLCKWTQNEGYIPINKNLWSLSYVLATSAISYIVFSVLYWCVDSRRYWKGMPFIFAGMNSIVLYIGHIMVNKQLPWRWTPLTNTHLELLAMDLTATTIWLIIAFILYRSNIFISL